MFKVGWDFPKVIYSITSQFKSGEIRFNDIRQWSILKELQTCTYIQFADYNIVQSCIIGCYM